MSAIYSTRFVLAAGAASSYLVPADKRAVIKCASAYNGAGSMGDFGLFIGSHPVLSVDVPSNKSVLETGLMIVLFPGELLQVFCSGGVNVQVSGFELGA